MQAHARMAGELGEPGTEGEAVAEGNRDRSDDQSRGQFITVSLKPGVAQVHTLAIFHLQPLNRSKMHRECRNIPLFALLFTAPAAKVPTGWSSDQTIGNSCDSRRT